MWRVMKLCVICMSLLCASAYGAAVANAKVLFGDQTVEASLDQNSAGSAEAFPVSSTAAGTASSVSVYVDANNTATTLMVGLYADKSGHPGSLRATGSLASPSAGAWNTVTLPTTTVSSGTYWLALLGKGGTLYFRDRANGPCLSEGSSSSALTSMPSTWTSGPQYNTCPISAYLNGSLTTTTTVTTAPANTSAPAVSGSPMQGQALSVSTGSWSGAPTSYTYQWKDCDTAGANCAAISGATSAKYTLQAADVGHTSLAVVTAANSAGSASAGSPATAVVAAPAGPTAAFAYSPSAPQTGQAVQFNASASACPAGPCTYSWADVPPSGGSWALGTGQTLSFTFSVAATKYVTLTVSDALGRTSSVEHNVIVSSATAPAPVTTAPANTAAPVISGSAVVGQTLSASTGSWSGSPTSYGYQWQDCSATGCSKISGATSPSYSVASADVGKTIDVVVAASNSAGSVSATSAPTRTVVSSSGTGTSGSSSCNLNATPSNFSAQVSAASAGQTICLASGNYGTWSGVNKAITITAASGASPQMVIAFKSGVGGFTLDHIANVSGTIFGGSNITIQNSTFTNASCTIGCLDVEGSMTNVVLNHDTFSYAYQSSSSGPNSKVFLDTNGSSPGAALTLENSYFANGDLDGIHFGGGSGDLVKNNFFSSLCDRNVNHTDNMQFEGGTQIAIVGNYVYTPGPTSSSGCVAGGIVSYDGGTNGLLIQDNVIDVTRDWGIELYSDQGSTVVHNTLVYHSNSYSAFNSGDGQIDIDRKSQDPAGSGTHVYDNVATVDFTNGSSGTADHNTSPSTVAYASACTSGCSYGGAVTHDNYLLAAGSAGTGAANDGSNDGTLAMGW